VAAIYITEMASVSQNSGAGGGVQYGRLPEITTQKLAAWPQVSAAFNQATQLIRVHTDTVCSISVGPAQPSGNNAAAAATNMRLAANSTEYFAVSPGHFLSVVANS
jgi:hypothetical protein